MRIKGRRERRGDSVAELAKYCGVSPQAVYQWENGDTKGLKPENLVAVAEKLHTYEKWLATGSGPEDRPLARDELGGEEERLIDLIRDLPESQRAVVTSLAQALHEQQQAIRQSGLR